MMPITGLPPHPEQSLLAEIVNSMQEIHPELFNRWILLERVDNEAGITEVWDELDQFLKKSVKIEGHLQRVVTLASLRSCLRSQFLDFRGHDA